MKKIFLALALMCGLALQPAPAEAFGSCSGSLYGTISYGGTATTTYGTVYLRTHSDNTSYFSATTRGGSFTRPHIEYMKWGYADGAVTYQWGLNHTSWWTFTGASHGKVVWVLACIRPY